MATRDKREYRRVRLAAAGEWRSRPNSGYTEARQGVVAIVRWEQCDGGRWGDGGGVRGTEASEEGLSWSLKPRGGGGVGPQAATPLSSE